MFFYRYQPVEKHLDRYCGTLIKNLDKAELVAGTKNKGTYKVPNRPEQQIVYFSVHEGVVTGLAALNKIQRWKALETGMLYVPRPFRRQGVALKLYDDVLKDGVLLMSGYSHNPKSRALWMKLVENKKYTTWAQDIVNLEHLSPIDVDDGDFVCDLKLYDDIKKLRRRRKHDVRICAINPRYA